ncbi:MAG TPA: phosphatidate cytidylyltransferase [Sphingobium sp.]|nr:phosphatidate cytidylyltransferase [Sphingobium sp.]
MGGAEMAGAARKSDLAVRTASAVVMLAIAGTALWMDGVVLQFFLALVAFLVVLEWRGLVVRFPDDNLAKSVWMGVGGVYVAIACGAALLLTMAGLFVPLLAAVIGTDVGAYFAGRLIGGPKIAPAISPSKTWAGLFGGMAGAALLLNLAVHFGVGGALPADPPRLAALGASLAAVAQAGDFFESWMKRRAGVKDSGTLIPGHGGMFDRVDGLLPVCIAAFLVFRNMGLMP